MKKNNKQTYLAFFTFLALLFLLAIQLNWIFKAAKLEEDHFNRMVKKALIEAREEIGNTASTCNDMKNYLCGNPCQSNVRKQKITELDSIIKSKLEIYHIDLDYTFEITDSTYAQNNSKLFGKKCYLQSLNGMLEKDGIKIRLQFPARNQFILAQIRGEFLLAIFSLLFVMFSFLLTLRMFRKEREMVQQTSDFINNMVHEFQTPLSNIRFAANLINKKQSVIADEKIAEYISVIIKENHKLENNVDKILKVSSENGNGSEPEIIDLHELIQQSCEEFKTRIESLEGKMYCKLEASNSSMAASADHISLIMSNLIDNAIKYSDGAPTVAITTAFKQGKFILKIADKGIGIEKKNLTRIFEKYYRVSTGDVHNVKGFGLGLTFVKKLVEKYNGKISASSTLGEGTVFTIVLPLSNEAN